MKFNDGFWLLKNGVKPYYALQVVNCQKENNSYKLHVSTRPIRHRGDTLGGPVLSICVHSPTQGVIGVEIEHFKEITPAPIIPLFPDADAISDVQLSQAENISSISTGGLTAEISNNPYTITFKASNRILTAAGPRHQGLFDVPSRWTLSSASKSSCLTMDPASNPNPKPLPDTLRYLNSELTLSPGELVYGLGEQFGPLVKNG
jgi:alpha-glucosidase (family GH31 glycosyl hydrolase)